jgi:protein TonB
MIPSRLKALLAALLLHAALLLFGGLLFFHAPARKSVERDVELIGDDAAQEKKPPEDKEKTPPETNKEDSEAEESLQAPKEAAPDMQEIARLEGPASAPELSALSLSELESALAGDSGGGDGIAEAISLSSGGRIGGTGDPAAASQEGPASFALSELDQRPQPLQQTVPRYPTELRKRKVQGTVEVVFLVDTDGRVLEPRVDKSTNEAFNQPALEAVRQWKFEAGTKEGKKVRFKMRVPITFSAG